MLNYKVVMLCCTKKLEYNNAQAAAGIIQKLNQLVLKLGTYMCIIGSDYVYIITARLQFCFC